MIALIELLLGNKVARVIAEILAIVALFALAAVYLEHRGAENAIAELHASSDKLIAKAKDDIAKETTAHAADVKANQEKLDAALAANTARDAQLARAVSLYDAYRRAHPDVARPAGPGGAAPTGECGPEDCGAVVDRLAVRGNELAGVNGSLAADLQSCQRDRDSLTGLPR